MAFFGPLVEIIAKIHQLSMFGAKETQASQAQAVFRATQALQVSLLSLFTMLINNFHNVNLNLQFSQC